MDKNTISKITELAEQAKVFMDFEKVIVVSHLPTMRDQFPVHFNVEKGPSGSCVNVVELG